MRTTSGHPATRDGGSRSAGPTDSTHVRNIASRQRHVKTRFLPQGDKKLLDVASAFALHPEIILLDEPTSGVSTADKLSVMQIVVGASRRMGIKSIIQVEHDMDIVFGYSDRIIALHQGKVLATGTPAAIRADENVMNTVVGRMGR